MSVELRRSECRVHGETEADPWCPPFVGREVVRCDHLGPAFVVEMHLIARSGERSRRSHQMHYVREERREVHTLDDGLSQERVDRIWQAMVAAMERGAAPNEREAHFHPAPNGAGAGRQRE